jgi:hypothetical protein|tara:strand:- start:5569 stop:6330 length:762 start_codon:yes stop_codon:yes gene_type:complete
MLFNKQRAKQLENRILKLSVNHKRVHALAFPKDNSDGEYQKHQKLRSDFYNKHKTKERDSVYDIYELDGAPCDWESTEISKYMKKCNHILLNLRNELLAINYYNAVRNSDYTFRMIDKAKDTINKYDYAGFGHDALEIDNLYPKSKEEIAKKEKWDNATMLERLEMKTFNYHVSSKDANDKCHNLVKEVCRIICSDAKVNREKVESLVEIGVEIIAEHCTIVEDKESVRAIESPINLALKNEGYGFEINVYDR